MRVFTVGKTRSMSLKIGVTSTTSQFLTRCSCLRVLVLLFMGLLLNPAPVGLSSSNTNRLPTCPARGVVSFSEGRLGFDFEATIKSGSHLLRIEERQFADLVYGEVAPPLPFAEGTE